MRRRSPRLGGMPPMRERLTMSHSASGYEDTVARIAERLTEEAERRDHAKQPKPVTLRKFSWE